MLCIIAPPPQAAIANQGNWLEGEGRLVAGPAAGPAAALAWLCMLSFLELLHVARGASVLKAEELRCFSAWLERPR